jgi:hypothetical protein
VLRTLMTVMTLSASAILTACDSSGIAGPGDFRRLAEAKQRWASRPFADYTYEIRTGCFCPPEVNQWARVEVRNNVVVDVDAVDPDPDFPVTTLSYWQPIDTLFADIERAISDDGFSSVYAKVNVTYDAQFGFPTTIEYISKPNIADAGASISVRNVVPLNGILQ